MEGDTVRYRSTRQKASDSSNEKNIKNVMDEPEEETGDSRWTTLLRVVAWIIFTFVFLPALGLLLVSLTAPAPIDPVLIRIPAPPKMEGALEVNDLLTRGERLFENELVGPESIVFHKGHMFIGTGDGKILDIKDGKINILATLGKPPSGSLENEQTCGRPLGLRMHKGSLYVIDTHLGLFKISVETGLSELLLSEVDGEKPAFLNDLDIDSDGIIYLTDSCKKWDRRKFMYPLLEGSGDGRLIRFDPHKKTTKVLVSGVHFANGVQLSKDESFVLVTETSYARILRYHLKGSKKGQVDTFMENLPGLPDNIRPSSAGGFWICGCVTRGPGFSMYDFLAAQPMIRKLLIQLFSVTTLQTFTAKSSIVYEVNMQSEVVRSFWDMHQSIMGECSEVSEHDGVLYTGSFHSLFIVRFDLKTMKKILMDNK